LFPRRIADILRRPQDEGEDDILIVLRLHSLEEVRCVTVLEPVAKRLDCADGALRLRFLGEGLCHLAIFAFLPVREWDNKSVNISHDWSPQCSVGLHRPSLGKRCRSRARPRQVTSTSTVKCAPPRPPWRALRFQHGRVWRRILTTSSSGSSL